MSDAATDEAVLPDSGADKEHCLSSLAKPSLLHCKSVVIEVRMHGFKLSCACTQVLRELAMLRYRRE